MGLEGLLYTVNIRVDESILALLRGSGDDNYPIAKTLVPPPPEPSEPASHNLEMLLVQSSDLDSCCVFTSPFLRGMMVMRMRASVMPHRVQSRAVSTIGFIGLGQMGSRMAANLVVKVGLSKRTLAKWFIAH